MLFLQKTCTFQTLVMQFMKKSIIYISSIVALMTVFFACQKKSQPLDNSQTIKVPYVLYGGTNSSAIYKTNNSQVWDKLKSESGAFTHGVYVCDTNLIFINDKVHVGSGMVTNQYAHVQENSFTVFITNNDKKLPGYVNNSVYDPAQKILYVCGIPKLMQSTATGKLGTYTASPFATTSGTIRSITVTANGDVWAWDVGNKLYKRTGGINNFAIVNFGTKKPRTANSEAYFISALDNKLIINDANGSISMFSTDGGVNWDTIANSKFGKNVLMGKQVQYNGNYYVSADSIGMFRLNGNSFIKDDGGIPQNTRIWDIVGKRNVYRTDISKYYYFLGTSAGTFKSENNAKDWVKINDTVFTALR